MRIKKIKRTLSWTTTLKSYRFSALDCHLLKHRSSAFAFTNYSSALISWGCATCPECHCPKRFDFRLDVNVLSYKTVIFLRIKKIRGG